MDNDDCNPHGLERPTIPLAYRYQMACLGAAILLMAVATTISLVALGFWTWPMFANFWAQRSFS